MNETNRMHLNMMTIPRDQDSRATRLHIAQARIGSPRAHDGPRASGNAGERLLGVR
jgi:hypothetical protein